MTCVICERSIDNLDDSVLFLCGHEAHKRCVELTQQKVCSHEDCLESPLHGEHDNIDGDNIDDIADDNVDLNVDDNVDLNVD